MCRGKTQDSGDQLLQPFQRSHRRHDSATTFQHLGIPGNQPRIKGVSHRDVHRVRTSKAMVPRNS